MISWMVCIWKSCTRVCWNITWIVASNKSSQICIWIGRSRSPNCHQNCVTTLCGPDIVIPTGNVMCHHARIKMMVPVPRPNRYFPGSYCVCVLVGWVGQQLCLCPGGPTIVYVQVRSGPLPVFMSMVGE